MMCSRDEDPCSLCLLFPLIVRRVLEKTAGAYVVPLSLGAVLPPGGERRLETCGGEICKSTGYVPGGGFGRRTSNDRMTRCMGEVSLQGSLTFTMPRAPH